MAVVVGRHGKVVYLEAQGYQDVGTGALIRLDILFRLASMTKPVTAVAAMVCTERGLFDLRTPVSEFVPGFAKAQVYKDSSSDAPETEAAREPVRVWHLLSQPSEVGRLALVHKRDEGTQALGALPPDEVLSPPARLEGGSGLISTLGDC